MSEGRGVSRQTRQARTRAFLRLIVVVALAVAGGLPALPQPASAGIIIQVNTSEDIVDSDGDCSLREAIMAANTNSINDGCGSGVWSGADSIRFNLGSGNPVINISSDLPEITEQATVAGNTGGATRTVIHGPGSGTGLVVASTATSSTIRHLAINNFSTGVRVLAASTTLIANYIGTDAAGTSAVPNIIGVEIGIGASGLVQVGGTNGITVGGSCTGDCNLISGNSARGIFVRSGLHPVIRGNFIGTDIAGTSAIGNGTGIRVEQSLVTVGGTATGAGNLISGNATGIFVLLQDFFSSAEGSVIQGNAIGLDTTRTVAIPNSVFGMRAFLNNALYPLQIGGTAAGAGNLVSGNTGGGIEIGQADNVVVQGNRIGTLADGVTPLGNGGTGIQLSSSTHSNVIGGIGAGEANVVAFNAVGISLGTTNYWNQFRGNSIHSNAGKGIDLADNQFNTIQAPVITGVIPVTGTSCAGCVIDVYSDASNEGKEYEGTVTADGAGNWTFNGAVTGPNVSATATFGSTSEFTAVAFDNDLDTVPNVNDNCPDWPNAAQALPSWTVPANDSDCDGFDLAKEMILETDPTKHCNADSGLNNEPDAWPTDFNDDMITNLPDVISFGPTFNKLPGQPGYNKRYDLNLTNQVLLSDVVVMGPFFNKICG